MVVMTGKVMGNIGYVLRSEVACKKVKKNYQSRQIYFVVHLIKGKVYTSTSNGAHRHV